MARKKLKSLAQIRRRELRQAAFVVLQTQGAAGTTLEKVAAQAGASKGMVLHYFKDKNELFEHAMREANLALREAVVARLKLAATPIERLHAIIDANFDEQFFLPSVCHAWLALCAEVPRDAQLARIQQVIHARMRTNLLSCLVSIQSRDAALATSLTITSLIDGLWLRKGLHADAMSAAQAAGIVKACLNALLADHRR